MSNYQLQIDEIIDKIKDIKAKTVGLQFPEGLKVYATEVARQIENKTSATVLISGDPCFGACDVCDVVMQGLVDILIHFGHTPLPLEYEVPVFFIEAQFRIDVTKALDQALILLKDYERIGLVTTTQHLHLLDEVQRILEKKGKKVMINEGQGTNKAQVLGCNFSAIENLPVDAFLYVGSGNFHPLGIKISTHKTVIIADPYRNEARNIDKFADRILRIRFAKIVKAREAVKFGIIVSPKKGQFRWELATTLKNMILKQGREAYLILMDNISPELLTPFSDLDAFLVTACPRIAIDDAEMYKKPMLTPEELLIVFNKKNWEDYQIDEIKYD